MRPANNSTTTVDSGFGNWNSPIPYLFGGLALMLGLISMALVILACSYRKYSLSDSSRPRDAEEKISAAQPANMAVDSEPKIVVIMAGDDNPTYLAKPVSSTSHGADHEQV
ncbi:protein GLUTAMINE DUMPER 4-like [Juglans microcarpa x Juglans regia]|uniref:protein GLUTAMINE DUMPER 4-like n=1 Tax=Juglans microcarpa x Juglans regia TaxID=2249226 RepID=UPI001B7EEC16|nr:protein GLUTAMINE DUMPER 4-like [Juglans microcarpa x Juglans regia]